MQCHRPYRHPSTCRQEPQTRGSTLHSKWSSHLSHSITEHGLARRQNEVVVLITQSTTHGRRESNKVLNSTIITYFDFVSKRYQISCTVCYILTTIPGPFIAQNDAQHASKFEINHSTCVLFISRSLVYIKLMVFSQGPSFNILFLDTAMTVTGPWKK